MLAGAQWGMLVSIEVRHVVDGDCDCGAPKYSWEHRNRHDHHWECDWGRIPSFDVESPAPLIITSRDFAHRCASHGRVDRIGALHTVEVAQVTEGTDARMFQRIDYQGRSWTWELHPAHWADPPTRYNNAHIPIYLGRWPD